MKHSDDETLVAHFLTSQPSAVADDGFTAAVMSQIDALTAAETATPQPSVMPSPVARMLRQSRILTYISYAAVCAIVAWCLVEIATLPMLHNAVRALVTWNVDAMLMQSTLTAHHVFRALPPLSHIMVVAISISIALLSQISMMTRSDAYTI